MYVGRGRAGKRAIPRLLPKVKGHLIESIAWNKVEQTEFTTGPILLGSSNGELGILQVNFVSFQPCMYSLIVEIPVNLRTDYRAFRS